MRYHLPIYVLGVSSHFWPFTKVNFVFANFKKSWSSVRPPPPCFKSALQTNKSYGKLFFDISASGLFSTPPSILFMDQLQPSLFFWTDFASILSCAVIGRAQTLTNQHWGHIWARDLLQYVMTPGKDCSRNAFLSEKKMGRSGTARNKKMREDRQELVQNILAGNIFCDI